MIVDLKSTPPKTPRLIVEGGSVEEQKMFRDMVRRLTKEKITPRAADIDREGKFPQDVYRLLCDNNLIS